MSFKKIIPPTNGFVTGVKMCDLQSDVILNDMVNTTINQGFDVNYLQTVFGHCGIGSKCGHSLQRQYWYHSIIAIWGPGRFNFNDRAWRCASKMSPILEVNGSSERARFSTWWIQIWTKQRQSSGLKTNIRTEVGKVYTKGETQRQYDPRTSREKTKDNNLRNKLNTKNWTLNTYFVRNTRHRNHWRSI